MRRWPFLTLAALLALAACGEATDDLAAYVGGDPVPSGAATIEFPWIGKQSVMCVGESFERMVAVADFSADVAALEVGSATLQADGTGTARFALPVAALRTGHEDRDTKMQGPLWLDADAHPEVVFEATAMKRVRPTVWKIDGTWTMKGVTKPVAFYANVRYLPEMANVGKDVVRVKCSFPLELSEYGVGGDYAGTPAVAGTWTVGLVLLGTMTHPQ
jgi:polyisoprenoid-binding protein YceI